MYTYPKCLKTNAGDVALEMVGLKSVEPCSGVCSRFRLNVFLIFRIIGSKCSVFRAQVPYHSVLEGSLSLDRRMRRLKTARWRCRSFRRSSRLGKVT